MNISPFGFGPTMIIKGVCVICREPFERKSHSGNAKRINKCGKPECDREARRRVCAKQNEKKKAARKLNG